ncbi:(2Fe-2S) ferredoxin domain-containing protein [Algoriphagus sp. CAU 1675]|uniref:(2Fe-2S) ferredoxin domain-containing protein n=1 Tax=Algoriphagus sp. CAU 1675 TaxID=3032597 RepID=UPI0023DC9C06|nr:(2Fe-2S) ferredoxin domain-containing protein [Algoriphagus sp. CAU 1675]MDF2158255.1 (2Fe-2S) ferredoxin domain-containing protein [Algoriphagus sp. CAU 1675]
MKHKRQLVFVCSGSDCKKSGGKEIRKDLKEALKTAPLKGNFKLIQTKCLDMCKSAPLVIFEDHFFKKASSEEVIQKVKKALKIQGPN